MHGNPQTVQELRREGGRWLRKQRERAGLSQRQLAARVGAEYYTLVSQLETGRGRVPPHNYVVWAEALNISPREFARTMMRFYDPVTYSILFEDTGTAGKQDVRRTAKNDQRTRRSSDSSEHHPVDRR
jgi:transcriptional regulator with XRE-family HTH domain